MINHELFLAIFIISICSVSCYIYVGIALWRLQKQLLTSLSVYVLTHQFELIENFGKLSFKQLSKANSLALDAMSFNRLLKLFLGWPLYQLRVLHVSKFVKNASRLLGDEKTHVIEENLKNNGVPQADLGNKKSRENFSSGFLVRRLNDELVAIFWYEAPARPVGDSYFAQKVLPFRVPVRRRLENMIRLLKRQGVYSQIVEGRTAHADFGEMSYVVVYEPFKWPTIPKVQEIIGLMRKDFATILSKVFKHKTDAGKHMAEFAEHFPYSNNVPSRSQLASIAFTKFLHSVTTPRITHVPHS